MYRKDVVTIKVREGVKKFLDKLSYLGLFCHFIKEQNGSKFSQIVSVRRRGGALSVSLTAFSHFFTPSHTFFIVLNKSNSVKLNVNAEGYQVKSFGSPTRIFFSFEQNICGEFKNLFSKSNGNFRSELRL